MKKCYLLLMACLPAFGAFSQSLALTQFMHRHQSDPGMSYAFLSKDLFEVAMKTDVKTADWQRVQQVVKNIGALSILAADSTPHAPTLYREALEAVPEAEYDALMSVRDGRDQVRFWSKEGEDPNVVSELVLLVGSDEDFVLVCFAGRLELDNFTELAALFQAKEAAQLAQTAQKVNVAFTLSPNPTRGELNLVFEQDGDAPAHLSVLDGAGKLCLERHTQAATRQTLDLSALPAGLYWVQLRTRQGALGVKPIQKL